MSKDTGVKTAICRLSSEEFCVNEVYASGYSKHHLGKYTKMKRIAEKQYGKRFTMNDYRTMFGFPLISRGRSTTIISKKDNQLLANWAMNPL